MPTALLGLLPSLIGGLGLIQGSNQSAEANNQRQAGVTALNDQNAIFGQDQALAASVPGNNALAIQNAQTQGSNLLNASLGQTAGRFAAGGGSPAGDTAFNFSALNDANRVVDPLKGFQAQLQAGQPQQQADILAQAKPGSLSSGYFQSSNMAQPPPSSFQASLAQLAQGLGAMGTAPGSGFTAPAPAHYSWESPASFEGQSFSTGVGSGNLGGGGPMFQTPPMQTFSFDQPVGP